LLDIVAQHALSLIWPELGGGLKSWIEDMTAETKTSHAVPTSCDSDIKRIRMAKGVI